MFWCCAGLLNLWHFLSGPFLACTFTKLGRSDPPHHDNETNEKIGRTCVGCRKTIGSHNRVKRLWMLIGLFLFAPFARIIGLSINDHFLACCRRRHRCRLYRIICLVLECWRMGEVWWANRTIFSCSDVDGVFSRHLFDRSQPPYSTSAMLRWVRSPFNCFW